VLASTEDVGIGLVLAQLEIAVALAPSSLLVTSKLKFFDLSKLGEVFNQLC